MSALAARLGSAARAALDFVLPQRCPDCGAGAEAARLLCDACRSRIPRLAFAVCARCAARGLDPAGCRSHAGYRVWPAWIYDERAALVVHALKYGERPTVARALGGALAAALPPGAAYDLVLEVPLHPARERERGYNQAALLADALAQTIGVPRLPRALERVRVTRPQARLGPRERRENLAGAFRVARPRWLEGRSVVIVDDVLTTGATLEACLAVLADAGARPVGATLAWAQ